MEAQKNNDLFGKEISEIEGNPIEFNKKFDDIIDQELFELEKEKEALNEAFEYQKKYLIEEVLDSGGLFLIESEKRKDISFESKQKSFDELTLLEEQSIPKKSFWNILFDYLFK